MVLCSQTSQSLSQVFILFRALNIHVPKIVPCNYARSLLVSDYHETMNHRNLKHVTSQSWRLFRITEAQHLEYSRNS